MIGGLVEEEDVWLVPRGNPCRNSSFEIDSLSILRIPLFAKSCALIETNKMLNKLKIITFILFF